MTASVYEAATPPLGPLPSLTGERRADVAVVGGGYTGLSAALHLAGRGYRVILLEAQTIGAGASGRNGGQVGGGQRLDQDELERRYGPTLARELFRLGEEAKATVKALIERHDIVCDLRPGLIEAAHHPREARDLPRYADKLARDYGYPHVRPLDRNEVRELVGSPRYHGGLLYADAAHLNPLAYARGLARAALAAGVEICEHSRVTAIAGRPPLRLRTATGSVRALHVVLACNAHLDDLEPALAGHILPITACQVATAPLPARLAARVLKGGAAVFDTKLVVDYFRKTGDGRLVFGGGEAYGGGPPADIIGFVRPHLLGVFPDLAEVPLTHGWAGRIAITRTRLPHFARPRPGVLAAQGYSGHGVALATLAGVLIAEAVAGTAERFDLMAGLKVPPFPGGTLLRRPALLLARYWFALRDRL
jgi:gamma-glutamylputrescine oxidase